MGDESVIKFSVEASMRDFSAKMGEFETLLKKVGNSVDEVGKKAKNGFGEVFKGVLSAEAVKGALEKVVSFSLEAVKAYDEELQVTMQLNLALGKHAEEIIKLAEAYSLETRYSKDALTQASAMMANRKLNSEQIKQLLPVAMDWAAKTGQSVADVTNQFVRGITTGNQRALIRFGITVDKTMSQQQIFNKIVASGQGEIKGFAKEMGKLGEGPLIIVLHQIEEMKSVLGKKLLPVFQKIVQALRDDAMPIAEKFIDNLDTIIPLAVKFGTVLITYFAATKIYDMAKAVTALEWSMKGLSAAMASNPIGVAALGILAAYAAIDYAKNKAEDAKQERFRQLTYAGNVGGTTGNELIGDGSGSGTPYGGENSPSSILKGLPKRTVEEQKAAADRIMKKLGGAAGEDNALKNQLSEEALNQKQLDLKEKQEREKERQRQKEKAESDAYTEWKKKDEEDVEALYNKEIEFKDNFRKEDEKLQKQMADELARANEETSKAREKQIDKFKQDAEEFAAVGQSIGESLGQGFVDSINGNREAMKDALKSILIDLLSFIEKKMIAAAVSSLVDIAIAGPLAPVAAANALGKAMMIGALFETLKAGVNSMGDGGPIFGQSHSAGGVIINAEGGEYILKKSAVDKYGTHTIEALNRGMIPAPSLQGYAAQTTIANSSRAASGGLVSSNGDITIVNVTDERQLDRYMASTRGRRAIVNAVGVERYKITKLTR
jgi:hypothetical protein